MSDLFYIPKKNNADHWYKEPWMLLVLGGPLIAVIAALSTFYIAWHGSDKVVSKDYYKQGININKEIFKDAKAVEYKLHGKVKLDPSSGKINFAIEGETKFPDSVLFTISTYSNASEYETAQSITLTQVKPGIFEGLITSQMLSDDASNKLWHVKIEGDNWRLTSNWPNPLHGPLQIKTQN